MCCEAHFLRWRERRLLFGSIGYSRSEAGRLDNTTLLSDNQSILQKRVEGTFDGYT
jgi:hypothetical protein